MNELGNYIKNIFTGLRSLLQGMNVTGYYFRNARKEIITQQYPDNKATLRMYDRFRGVVVMPHSEDNLHACTGCSACEIACPNGSIEIIAPRYEDPETGKRKKIINQFVYHYSMCTLCNLCILSCPTDAIKMDQTFEHAVYDRSLLTQILNKPGSKLDPNVKE